uniref:Galactose-binding domain-containing protein n=1 Tax=Cucumis melo TaxID=3656 RepID=A0A9I9CNE9_CUCME
MEIELEPRVKPLDYKVKGVSRESPSQKAANVLDSDLRTHWSTATNTKEWILLELDEPCLLSHIRIYNKSVLEWEIAAGLRYKPETFVKVRSRCEAPRRDMIYPMNYTPCRYVKISCLRGNPIAVFFIQLIGVPVSGLEPEFHPVVNHLLPHIVSHRQDGDDMHLQLLQDMTVRLFPFLPQLETDLVGFSDAPDLNLRFLAMLAGPFYPILHLVNERAASKSTGNGTEIEVSKNYQMSSPLTVSSNFEPRKSRSILPVVPSTSSSVVFRPDAIFTLLRMAYKNSTFGSVCRVASRILLKLVEPIAVPEVSSLADEAVVSDEFSKPASSDAISIIDYSKLFGEDFEVPDDKWDLSYLSILDVGAVEEGILHILFACASQPNICSKLAERSVDLWLALPLVQALLPVLRPPLSSPFDVVNDIFSLWKRPVVQQALSQIVATLSSPLYHPLLHACAGYLSSFSQSHAKAGCVLIDLCSSVLAPWMPRIIAKVDLVIELLEDLLGVIQNARHSLDHARAALKYILLALSGYFDDILGNYKEVKHKILFLVEMLEPFLDPAICGSKIKIAFGDLSPVFPQNLENSCVIALNVIRLAVQKPSVLPSLEFEWRRGSVAPSVLLSVLQPHLQLPTEVDLRKSSASKPLNHDFSVSSHPGNSSKFNALNECEGKIDDHDTAGKSDVNEDASPFFVPPELRCERLDNYSSCLNEGSLISSHGNVNIEPKEMVQGTNPDRFHGELILDFGINIEYFNLEADYLQLVNYRDCEVKASEFRRLALDLSSQSELTSEGHDAAIDALLLAAECYVNPYFMMSCRYNSKHVKILKSSETTFNPTSGLTRLAGKSKADLETIAHLERKRDKVVLQILLEAAELDRKYHLNLNDSEFCPYNGEELDEKMIMLSSNDVQSADAVTLVRQNQALLCTFVIRLLQRKPNSMHEILMQSLLFFLHSATKLHCSPEDVIDIILGSAEFLNGMLTSLYYQIKDGNLRLEPGTIHGTQRHWILLQKLVHASSGGNYRTDFTSSANNSICSGNLIPASAWMHRISKFSVSQSPLARFLGWMAVSRNAKQYMMDRLFLASDLPQLTSLLHIFSDELSGVDNIYRKHNKVEIEETECRNVPLENKDLGTVEQHGGQSFHVMYPDLSEFFPNMRNHFVAFGEVILEAVGLQLRSLSSNALPDILCWFSDLCSWPFFQSDVTSHSRSHFIKGYVSKNAKCIVLHILEAIVSEHMEPMIPEIPRLVQVLVSLCGAAYCDVPFLNSVVLLLKPLISYSLQKISIEEQVLDDGSCTNFESLCFNELLSNIKENVDRDNSLGKVSNKALSIFVLASFFPDFSFQLKREILQSLISWVDFTSSQPTSYFHDYLCSFQKVMESCRDFLLQNLKAFGGIPIYLSDLEDASSNTLLEENSNSHLGFISDIYKNPVSNSNSENLESTNEGNNTELSAEEIGEFRKDLDVLISRLFPTIEHCWNLHHQLAKNLTVTMAECLVYSQYLSSVAQNACSTEKEEGEHATQSKTSNQLLVYLRGGLRRLAETATKLEEESCWEAASVIIDCLLGLPCSLHLENIVSTICSALRSASCNAPRLSWRLQTQRWLSALLRRGISAGNGDEDSLVDMFCTMLGHPEPEQRYIALQQLGNLVGIDVFDGTAAQQYSQIRSSFISTGLEESVSESVLSHLVSHTWDQVASLAASDSSLYLRTRAMALLIAYVPYASRHELQSLLSSADCIHGTKVLHPASEGPLLQLSLALISSACLHSPIEDVFLIPESVWRNIEALGSSKSDGRLGDLERKACQVLCRLRNEGDEAKAVLKEVLSSSSAKKFDEEFLSIRESILQVLSNMASVQSYFDVFSQKKDEETMELEEAELELDIAKEEFRQPDSYNFPGVTSSAVANSRLQQIKNSIRSIEKSQLQEEVAARRQKRHLMRQARHKYLEDAALHEAELLQELDRERTVEMEKEIERQRLLELERARTRELRYNLDMEKERQMQRELQRELEQAESGPRSSRREFSSSSHSSRPRDRYRERDNGRPSNEGNARTTASGLQTETSTTTSSSMTGLPTIVLSGARQYSGQLPTILQSRERPDECGSSYDENVDGSKDSGDTGSVGDPELVSIFDGHSGPLGSGQRHGSRGSKSRQVIERRERDGGRREGKWERKHS